MRVVYHKGMTTQQDYEVLDNHGISTGKLMSRELIHNQQLWHAVVHVWIINSKGEILLKLRSPDVELSPNMWDVSVGSHVKPGEDPVDAALRCLQEKLELPETRENIKHLFNILCANPLPDGMHHNVLGHVYLVQRDIDLTAIHFDTTEISQLKWVPLMQLMNDMGNDEQRKLYQPRASNYYTQLFQAFEAYM